MRQDLQRPKQNGASRLSQHRSRQQTYREKLHRCVQSLVARLQGRTHHCRMQETRRHDQSLVGDWKPRSFVHVERPAVQGRPARQADCPPLDRSGEGPTVSCMDVELTENKTEGQGPGGKSQGGEAMSHV